MKKVISFSLWGDDSFYTVGAIENAKLALDIYPDWICRYYIGPSVPESVVQELDGFPNTELVMMNQDDGWNGMFWRFYPIVDSEVDVMISRDVDCRLSKREKGAVDQWLSTGKTVHVMRDHPLHSEPIMGGMWGCRTTELYNLICSQVYVNSDNYPDSVEKIVSDWLVHEKQNTSAGTFRCLSESQYDSHGIDQKFLRNCVYYAAVSSSQDRHLFVHDSFPLYNPWSRRLDFGTHPLGGEFWESNTGFPTPRENSDDFIGQIYYADGTSNKESSDYLEMRQEFIYQDDKK
tara:strand:- start:4078 stop:4947 length:870 start_codon:yes stop_codon:yes gene_type:complete